MNIKSSLFILALTMLLTLLAACGGYDDETSSDDDDDATDGDSTDDDDDDSADCSDFEVEGTELGDDCYPVGPYGESLGDVMANFSMKDANGNTVRLGDFVGSYNGIMINQSAGWCSACRDEMGTLVSWYDELHDQGFMLIQAIFEKNTNTIAADQEFVQEWVEEYDVPFPVLVDVNNYFLPYNPSIQAGSTSFASPLTIILNKRMEITYVQEGSITQTLKDKIVANISE